MNIDICRNCRMDLSDSIRCCFVQTSCNHNLLSITTCCKEKMKTCSINYDQETAKYIKELRMEQDSKILVWCFSLEEVTDEMESIFRRIEVGKDCPYYLEHLVYNCTMNDKKEKSSSIVPSALHTLLRH